MAVKRLETVGNGESIVVDATEGVQITVLTAAGTTATISRVDDRDASAATGHGSDVSVAADSRETIPVDWPFYFVSSSGGDTRVALV